MLRTGPTELFGSGIFIRSRRDAIGDVRQGCRLQAQEVVRGRWWSLVCEIKKSCATERPPLLFGVVCVRFLPSYLGMFKLPRSGTNRDSRRRALPEFQLALRVAMSTISDSKDVNVSRIPTVFQNERSQLLRYRM